MTGEFNPTPTLRPHLLMLGCAGVGNAVRETRIQPGCIDPSQCNPLKHTENGLLQESSYRQVHTLICKHILGQKPINTSFNNNQ